MKLQRLCGAICAVLMLVLPARATEQSSYVMPVVGPMNMATFAATLNAGLRAIASCSWGSSAPANGPTAAVLPYQCWADTTANPVVMKIWDGTSWAIVAKLNTSSHLWTPSFQGTDLSTASTAATGTSGHTLGFLDGANTWSAIQAGATAAVDTNTTQFATTAFVLAQAAAATPLMDGSAAVGTSTRFARADHVHASDTSRAPLASPALTGTPTTPTAAVDTNTTQIASTAYVIGQAASATPLMDGAAAVGTSTRFARADHVHASDTSRAATANNLSDLASKPTARVNLNIDQATSTGDANYTVLSTDRGVYHTALSAARTDTLPAANAVNPNQLLVINDPRGVATASNTVTVARAGADTVNGGTSFVALNAAYGSAECRSDGSSRWICNQTSGGGGSGVTSVTVAGGAGLTTSGTCTVTTSGTCTITPDPSSLTMGGRLTLVSGVPEMTTDVVGAQNVYLAPDTGRACPIYNGTTMQPYQFTSSATDQVGLTLALAGSANWPANTIFDVFCTLNSGVPVLATRAWDSSMLPVTAQITNVTTITTGTGANAWVRSTAAFDGTTAQADAAAARNSPSNSGTFTNCLGQDWGVGQSKVLSQVIITAPTDDLLRGDGPTSLAVATQGSNDLTNWELLDVRNLNVSGANGQSFTIPINATNTTAYRYDRTCIAGNGTNAVNVAELQYYATTPPSTRRLTKYNGVPVNDALVATARINSTTTISMAQYQGTYVGAFQTDAATAGQVTAHVNYGASRAYNINNYWNQHEICLRAGTVYTSASNSYQYTITTPTNIDWGPVENTSTYSLTVLQGYATDFVTATFPRAIYLNSNSPSGAAGYESGIGVDNTKGFCGTEFSSTFDTTGVAHGFQANPLCILPPYAGTHTFYGVEKAAYTLVGAVTVGGGARNNQLQACFRG